MFFFILGARPLVRFGADLKNFRRAQLAPGRMSAVRGSSVREVMVSATWHSPLFLCRCRSSKIRELGGTFWGRWLHHDNAGCSGGQGIEYRWRLVSASKKQTERHLGYRKEVRNTLGGAKHTMHK